MQRLAFLPLVAGIVACNYVGNDDDAPVWELVWEEEFNGDAGEPPRDRFWSFDIGRGDNGWGNNELQYYTDRSENIGLTGNSELRITSLAEDPGQEAFENAEWTSARITTKDKFDFQYGRVLASIKTPVDRAIWPAFWMLGADIDDVGWPVAGEIDIMEVFGVRSLGVALHGPFYSGGNNVGFEYLVDAQLEGYAEDFHTYELIWDPQQVMWLIDDNIVAIATQNDTPPFSPWVFDHPFYFLLNMAVGGNPVQAPDDTTPETAEMLVDFIRVFERREPLLDPFPFDPEPLPQEAE
ncbi:MAG: glycoside hydrolase family 16 protein [Myxococcota bacterium]